VLGCLGSCGILYMKQKVFSLLKFIIPFGLWLFIFSDAVTGKLPVNSDCYSFYSLLKYFLDNLRIGHFALWCPFVFWGGSFLIELNAFGAFNPIWIFALVLNKIGLSFYLSFLYTYIGYFFLGHIGFYLLAKSFLKDKLCAYGAFLFFLFSTSGFLIFYYPYHIFIFVSLIWFFYFLIKFWQEPHAKFFIGIIFSIMIILNCYLPFYWLSVFVFVIISYLVVYFLRIEKDLRFISNFISKNYIVVIICFFALGVSLLSAFKAYHLTKTGEVICFERKAYNSDPYQGGAVVSYDKIANSSPSTLSFSDSILLDRDSVLPSSIIFFYVSFFVWCILCLSIFNKLIKKSIILILLLLILMCVIIADQSILFRSIFHVFFWFSYIRNLGVFVFVFLPILILFATLQLKLILRDKLFKNRRACLIFISIVHGGLLTLLVLNNGFFSSYITVLLSFLFFILINLEVQIRRWVYFVLLGLCIVVQPVEVMWRFRDNIENMSFIRDKPAILDAVAYPPKKVKFYFSRPSRENSEETFTARDAHLLRIRMTGSAGFPFEGAGFPPEWSFYLSKNISEEELNQYVQHKFYIYDHVKAIDSEERSLNLLKEIFEKNTNLALISKDGKINKNNLLTSLEIDDQASIVDRAKIILSSSNLFSVLDFNTNSIKVETNFDKVKFLVYTDSFQSDWRVFVNGQKQNLYRSNFGFKGVALPKGKNVVFFKYSPLGGQMTYFLIFSTYIGLFLWLIILFIWSSRNRKKEDC